MRGLEIRSMYAIAIVQMALNPEKANEQLLDVYERCFALGWAESEQEGLQAPTMFQDVPELANLWTDGRTVARQNRQIDSAIFEAGF